MVCHGDYGAMQLSAPYPLKLIQGLLTLSAWLSPPITPLLSCGFLFSSKMLKPQTNSSVFGSLQNLKEDKTKPVRDEYEYVSDEGELKIDEFPIRRKKNTVKRDLSCECFVLIRVEFQFVLTISCSWVGSSHSTSICTLSCLLGINKILFCMQKEPERHTGIVL